MPSSFRINVFSLGGKLSCPSCGPAVVFYASARQCVENSKYAIKFTVKVIDDSAECEPGFTVDMLGDCLTRYLDACAACMVDRQPLTEDNLFKYNQTRAGIIFNAMYSLCVAGDRTEDGTSVVFMPTDMISGMGISAPGMDSVYAKYVETFGVNPVSSIRMGV